MTQYNNNLSPLPWYSSLDEQNHRRPYAYGSVYPLFTPANFMLPWQAPIPRIGSMVIYREDGTLWRDVTEQALNNIHYSDGITYFYPRFALSLDQPEGRYYAVIRYTSNVRLYSEVYTVVGDLSGLLKVEWWDEETLVFDSGRIIYEYGYRNHLFLASQLGKPQYGFEEEGERRDGYFFPTKMLSEKTYRFQFIAPEYMCDAMRLARLSDHVRVTDQYGRVYDCDTFLITPKWGQNGDVATVTAEFETNTVVKKTGMTAKSSGGYDFNEDFNNDFLINQNS